MNSEFISGTVITGLCCAMIFGAGYAIYADNNSRNDDTASIICYPLRSEGYVLTKKQDSNNTRYIHAVCRNIDGSLLLK